MAVAIQQGEDQFLLPLWDRMQRLAYMLAWRFYSTHERRCAAAGVTLDDLHQEAYLAFLDAVNSYRPESGFLLSPFLNFPARNRFKALVGLRAKRLPLNQSLSLDAPISEEDAGLTLGNTLEDKTSPALFEAIAERDYQERLHESLEECLAIIPQEQAETIRESYYEGKSYAVIAEEKAIPRGQVRNLHDKGLRSLRSMKCRAILKEYREDVISGGYHGGLRSFRYTGISSTERAAERLDELERRWYL